MTGSLLYIPIGLAAYLFAGCLTGLLVSYLTNLGKTQQNPLEMKLTALSIVIGWPEALLELLVWRFESHR